MSDSAMARREFGRPDDHPEFLVEERELRARLADIALAIGVVLMPLGSLLDWSVYREQFYPLLAGRLLATSLLAVGLATRRIWCSGRWFKPVSFFLILTPGLFISWMIFLTEGAQSHYYFGLIVLMIIVQMLAFSAGEALLYCGTLLGSYAIAVVAAGGDSSAFGSDAVQGYFFLFICSVTCVAVCHTYRRSRFESFCLNRDLAREERLLRESIEQLRETEQKLVHSEKMRAIAGVAAGLLHEINNPVNYSMMALKVLRKQLRRGVDVDETLEDVEAGVSRIGEIVSDLQSFAHPDQLTVKSPFLLRDAALSAIRFLTHELPQDRVLIDEASEVGATVYGAQTQIVQVLLNLILNAEKAIRALRENSEGSSSAATRDRETDAWRSQRITIRAVSKDSRLIVSVIDNGIGMDESQLKLVRQPFFTTRSGEGLGLGLGICETIVQSHGGQLVIESELGKGTEVSFDLPLQASTEPDQRSSLTDSQTAPRPSSQSPGTFSA